MESKHPSMQCYWASSKMSYSQKGDKYSTIKQFIYAPNNRPIIRPHFPHMIHSQTPKKTDTEADQQKNKNKYWKQLVKSVLIIIFINKSKYVRLNIKIKYLLYKKNSLKFYQQTYVLLIL